MEIILKFCNNINEGNITIEPKKLNIKYGINGTGKSTIVKAIELNGNNQSLKSLTPFTEEKMSKEEKEARIPTITTNEAISKIVVYNTEYIRKYMFIKNNLLNNSYDIFIKPDDYENKKATINNNLKKLNDALVDNKIFTKLKVINDNLTSIFKLNKAQVAFVPKAPIYNILNNHEIDNIPKNMLTFESFIKSEKSIGWYNWNKSGKDFILNNKCPYCSKIIESELFHIIEALEKYFDVNTVETHNIVTKSIQDDSVINENIIIKLQDIFSSRSTNDEDKKYVLNFILELRIILEKLNELVPLSFESLINVETENFIKSKKINNKSLSYFSSDAIINEFKKYNEKIDEVLENITSMKKEISILNYDIRKTSFENSKHINDFLKNSGIKYRLTVNEAYDNIQIVPEINNQAIAPSEHLSYGEMNSLSLALFAFQFKDSNDTLIVLDDPISSYDENKKYAIYNFLFSKNMLREKTCMLLTHDIEPIINIYKIGIRTIPNYVSAKFLENKNGSLSEFEIKTEHILNISKCFKILYEDNKINVISRLINYRKYLEVLGDYNLEYSMLSSLLKLDEKPFINSERKILFDKDQIPVTEKEIANKIVDFKYNELRKKLLNISEVIRIYNETSNNFEKIELFRIISAINNEGVEEVLDKFIKESYHIENSYLFQLNPLMFNTIPNYIIQACNSYVSKIKI